MTVVLVLLTFAIFIGLDLLLQRLRAPERAREVRSGPAWKIPAALQPVWVSGYQLPEELHYHPGHTWVRQVAPETVLVGIDDFARRLVGPANEVRLPTAGDTVRQGDACVGVVSGERQAELVSPVDGEVVTVNSELETRPGVATDDPYRRGWLFAVRPTALARDLRNLLSGGVARRWIEEARERLQLELMALSGSVVQDGGEPAADYAGHLTDEDWRRLVADFLLT